MQMFCIPLGSRSRQVTEALLVPLLGSCTAKTTLLVLSLVSFSVLCNNFPDNYKTTEKTPVLLIGRQHSGVRHSSCTEPVSNGMKKSAAWEERSQRHEAAQSPCEEDFKYTARITTLAETERLFDELTHEKQQAKIIFVFQVVTNHNYCVRGEGWSHLSMECTAEIHPQLHCHVRNVPLSFPAPLAVLPCP